MRSHHHKFSIDLPGNLTDTEIESVLPSFIWISERQSQQPRISVAQQIKVLDWEKSKLENGEWLVDINWSVEQE